MSVLPADAPFAAKVEFPEGAGRILLVCEHASNAFPAPWGDLGLTVDQQDAHIAWDPGALGLARALAQRLGAGLVHAPVSRLIYDLNRAPDQAAAMASRSEVFDIPGNHELNPAARVARTKAVYLTFHDALHAEVCHMLAQGTPPVLITIHSFTPVYHGQPRMTEFGVIHDADDRLARAIVDTAQDLTGLRVALNDPYSAADGVTHTLRLHATPYGLVNAMLEVRNDLLATPGQVQEMAALLAPVLAQSVEKVCA